MLSIILVKIHFLPETGKNRGIQVKAMIALEVKCFPISQFKMSMTRKIF